MVTKIEFLGNVKGELLKEFTVNFPDVPMDKITMLHLGDYNWTPEDRFGYFQIYIPKYAGSLEAGARPAIACTRYVVHTNTNEQQFINVPNGTICFRATTGVNKKLGIRDTRYPVTTEGAAQLKRDLNGTYLIYWTL